MEENIQYTGIDFHCWNHSTAKSNVSYFIDYKLAFLMNNLHQNEMLKSAQIHCIPLFDALHISS